VRTHARASERASEREQDSWWERLERFLTLSAGVRSASSLAEELTPVSREGNVRLKKDSTLSSLSMRSVHFFLCVFGASHKSVFLGL